MKGVCMQFRPLSEPEKLLIRRLIEKGRFGEWTPEQQLRLPLEDFLVRHEKQPGGFTVCILAFPSGLFFLGASRCSHKDKPRAITGELVALRRAVLWGCVTAIPELEEEEQPKKEARKRKPATKKIVKKKTSVRKVTKKAA
jgi:hypothetical protein